MRVTVENVSHPAAVALRADLAEHYVTRHGAHDLDADDPADFTPPRGAVLIGWSHDGHPVATISVTPTVEPGRCEWRRAYVQPGHRFRGWPGELLRAALAHSRAHGYRSVIATTTAGSLPAIAGLLGIRCVERPPLRRLDALPGCLTFTADLDGVGRRRPMTVDVRAVNPRGVLAYVDGVRVRIRVRNSRPPTWWCDAHPSDGRTACAHIDALADTPYPRTTPTPTKEKNR